MKTIRSANAVNPSSDSPLFDALLLIIAGAALEAQTHGALKPFGAQRLTLKTMAARSARSTSPA